MRRAESSPSNRTNCDKWRAGQWLPAYARSGFAVCAIFLIGTTACLPSQQSPDDAVISIAPTVDGDRPNGGALDVAISADGRVIAFSTLATNLVFSLPSGMAPAAKSIVRNQLNSSSVAQLYVFDVATRELQFISVNAALEPANGACTRPALSHDGRYVCYLSSADNLVTTDRNGASDVFVFDRETATTTRVSVSETGAEADGASIECDISADGSCIVFTSLAENLVETDVNGVPDIFVRDLASKTTTRVNLSTDGLQAVAPSGAPSISDDGNVIAFHSDTDRLVENDTNEARDVFVHFREMGVTQRMLTRRGFEPDGDNFSPRISGDGAWVAFVSRAGNMIDDDVTSSDDVYLTEIATGRVFLCTVDEDGEQLREGGVAPSVSFDGAQVAFVVQRNKFDETTRRDFIDTDILLYRRSQEATTGILANAVPATLSPCAGLLCPEAPTTTMPRLSGDGCTIGYLLSDQSATVPEVERRCEE
ncbi:MAG: TolB family protein [Phycisphaerae bacterium]